MTGLDEQDCIAYAGAEATNTNREATAAKVAPHNVFMIMTSF